MDDAIAARFVTAILDFEIDARPDTVADMGSKFDMLELVGAKRLCVTKKTCRKTRHLVLVCLTAYAGIDSTICIVIDVDGASRHDERHVSCSK